MFGVPAVIIREALSERRGMEPTSETTIFRWLLQGLHPLTGASTGYDRDQMDPVRADLQGLRWLKKVLPFHLLTTSTGLSSLLAFMSTGQGCSTSDFLRRMEAEPDKMHFPDLQACVARFEMEETKSESLGPNSYKYCNQTIYGTANAWYSVHRTIRVGQNQWRELSIEEKFTPIYLALLGPLANQDPASSDAPRPEWHAVLSWIVNSGLNGFGSGLAPLQLANNLVLAGVAALPLIETVAQWIYLNKGYGAFRGLQVLGFELPPNASPAAVRAAFLCFYTWLDHLLTAEDKSLLRYIHKSSFAKRLRRLNRSSPGSIV
ncbi:hypothetical protein R3P38DRAFT_3165866 [Favolaschia claudopus]|uniref:Uncharacterized protein n=1 Tax=Favolaschia claudopus TaxID=2862362 RepID=A0AAW0EKQ5_9AGAR